MTQRQHTRAEDRPDQTSEKHRRARVVPNWPDQKARQEMSEAEVTRNGLGKHAKNRDWERAW